ncbi:MAG: hypothetical protein DRI69_04895 [Bacteroidetes bacterium]|nr:MAG: hypothetical protein DRI69_04895 [Bacteroidota bacterium]
MKTFNRVACTWAAILLLPALAFTQHFRVAEWDMTMDEIAAVETVDLETSDETAKGSTVVIAGLEFDVIYTFSGEEILTQEAYTKSFEDDASRDAAYVVLQEHLTSKYGAQSEGATDRWVRDDAVVSIEKSPATLTLRVENPESPEDRIARKKKVLEAYKISLMEEIGASKHPIRVKACSPFGNDFAKSVNVQVLFDYYGPTTIKYMWFTVAPYNDKGQKLKCNAKGHSSYTFEIMGPFRNSKITNDVSWDEIWKNPNVSCVKLTKLKVEYVDGKTYTYVSELSKIQWPHFMNTCN